MKKKLFIGLIVLMTFSLTGIVLLQVSLISESINVKEKQFSQLITQSLVAVADDLKLIDVKNFAERYKKAKLSKGSRKTKEDLIRGITVDRKNSIVDDKSMSVDKEFSNLEFTISHEDSIRARSFVKQVSDKEAVKKRKSSMISSDFLNSFSVNDSISVFQLALLEEKYLEHGNKISIRKRIDQKVLERLISLHLSQNNILTRFEYAIMNNGLITPVYSKRFRQTGNEYVVPVFLDKEGNPNYELYVQFPNKRDFVLSSMKWMLFFSIVFTLIIIMTFAGALSLIFKHKKNSDVKTDFINNMTHELKTPIATISLSIDAIRNPKIISDKDKILHYANVIKDENKRMHQQIENVLRISRLDKNTLGMTKEEASFNELVEEAIEHLLLIVEDRGGSIEFDLDAENDSVFVDVLHFGNILVNILDNANKYSLNAPEIKVSTYNEGDFVAVEVSDNGMGISKSEQEKIFDKFFRVSKGNIYNIKGQGLGLAYVKQIVDAHDGFVTVKSAKGKGSTFKITIPVYNDN